MWNSGTTWMKNGRVVLGCHATAGQGHWATWVGESQQNDLPAQCINALLCVVPLCFATLHLVQALGRQPCVQVIGPTYTLLYGEGICEQGRSFHGLALLSGEGSAKHTGYAEGVWMLRTKCAPGVG